MHKRTPARPALPWAMSIALDLIREPLLSTGDSKPKNAASAKRPAAILPKSPAGVASPIGHPLSMITTISRVPNPNKRCSPTRTGFRLPCQRRARRTTPRAIVPKGNRINGLIGMLAPSQNHDGRNLVKDNLQIAFPAMPSCLFVDFETSKALLYASNKNCLPRDRVGLPEWPLYRKFARLITVPKTSKSANLSSIDLNANRQALTS